MSLIFGILFSILVFVVYFSAYYYLASKFRVLGKIIITVIVSMLMVFALLIGFVIALTKVAIENQLQCQKNLANWCRTTNFYYAVAFCNDTWYAHYGFDIINNTAHVYTECDNKTFGYIRNMIYPITVKCDYNLRSDSVDCTLAFLR